MDVLKITIINDKQRVRVNSEFSCWTEVLEVLKIIKGMCDPTCVPHFDFIELSEDFLRTMGNYKRAQHQCHYDFRKYTYTNRVIPIWFQKAFDSVCHKKLFTRLSALGIAGNLLAWIKNFLTDRQQCTRVGDMVSDTVKIISEVMQGSCLGPVLFCVVYQ